MAWARLWRRGAPLCLATAAGLFLVLVLALQPCDRPAALQRPSVASVGPRPQAGRLPPGIVQPLADLHPRRLHGNPSTDPPLTQCCLLVLTVGAKSRANVVALLEHFSPRDFQLVIVWHPSSVSQGSVRALSSGRGFLLVTRFWRTYVPSCRCSLCTTRPAPRPTPTCRSASPSWWPRASRGSSRS